MPQIPKTFPIIHDDYHAEHIGKCSDGTQFFLTTPFVPADGVSEGGEFIALYRFDREGYLVDSEITPLGPRENLDKEAARAKHEDCLKSLGSIEFCDIQVSPSKVLYEGIEFGLIVREPDDEDDEVAIEMQPGNYMAFFEPWDGTYDT